jgi:KUP system potassium uptake protein
MGAMAITAVLFGAVARTRWGWSFFAVGPLVGLFLLIDLTCLASSLTKVRHDGWIPLAIAGGVFAMMTTWSRGCQALAVYLEAAALPLEVFMADLARRTLHRPAGTAVFLSNNPDDLPIVLLHQVKHNKCLHQQVVILCILTENVPAVPDSQSLAVRELGSGCCQVTARYGFMQSPNVPAVLQRLRLAGQPIGAGDPSFYLGHDTILTTGRSGLRTWRKQLFALLSRNANFTADYFGLPPNRVVELGAQIQL